MPIYMTPPNPDEFDPSLPEGFSPEASDYLHGGNPPQGPSPEASVDYFHKGQQGASVDYFIKGESGQVDYFVKAESAQVDYFVKAESAQVDYFVKGNSPEGFSWGEREAANAGPGAGPHARTRKGGGALGILIGLLLFSLVGILIGLLIFIAAPPELAGGAANLLMGSGLECVNGDSPRDSASAGILIGLNNFRTSMGGESFFQGGCSQPTEVQAEPPPAPTNANSSPNTQPTKTPVPSNNTSTNPNTSGGGDQPNQPNDPCLPNNGGMSSYEPNYCNCNGTTSTIIFCKDGTRIETANPGGSCQPDPALCQQPSTDGGGQQPPTCEYKCYVSDPNKPEQCLQGGWVYPGTDTYCDPNNP